MQDLKLLLILTLAGAINENTDCSSNTATEGFYYDTSLLDCRQTETGKVPSSDGFDQVCEPGTAKNPDNRDFPEFTCIACPINVASDDQYFCQSCPSQVLNEIFDCDCEIGSAIIEIEESGAYLNTKRCQLWADEMYQGLGSHSCQRCPHVGMIRESANQYACQCDGIEYRTAGDSCVGVVETESLQSQFKVENAVQMIYTDNESSEGEGSHELTSDAFTYYYLLAARDCSLYKSIDGCQRLANLCVLQLYNDETTVCKLYRDVVDKSLDTAYELDDGWVENVPWLYYEKSAEDVLDDADKVSFEVTFSDDEDDKVFKMKYKLAMYALNGAFLGWKDLEDELILCPHYEADTDNFKEFGTNLIIECDLDLEPYITLPETIFYELFLEDGDNLIDVPVLVRDYVDKDGETPNDGDDEGDWQLMRRFFIYDNVSGVISNYNQPDTESTVLQYAKDATLKVKVQTDEDERIFVPLLLLDYKSRLTKYITEDDDEDRIRFESLYTMDTDKVWLVALALLSFTMIVSILISMQMAYSWSKNNPASYNPEATQMVFAGKFVMILLSMVSLIHFWYLFLFSAYWFVFYKMQYHVFILMPDANKFTANYEPFYILFGIVLGLHVIRVIDIIWQQVSVDYIFIDWETPRRVLRQGADQLKAIMEEQRGQKPSADYYKKGVSAWRTLFVTNELNEIQTYRYISLEFTLIWLLFFLHGVDLVQLTQARPGMDVEEDGTESPVNPILRFFVDGFLILGLGYFQLVSRRLGATWFPTKFDDFVDLCSISNISVFIFDQLLHGYYIHGESPHGNADGTMDELRKQLELASQGGTKHRGVEEGKDLQTFEVYIPWKLRQHYDEISKHEDEEETRAASSNKKLQEASKYQFWLYSNELPKDIDYNEIEKLRFKLNEDFKDYIHTMIQEARPYIMDKSALQRCLNMPPTDLSEFESVPFFYRDPAQRYESIFYCGKEFDLLLLDFLVFALVDMLTFNAFIAALVCYVVSKGFKEARQALGERNLSKKTRVDDRFLI